MVFRLVLLLLACLPQLTVAEEYDTLVFCPQLFRSSIKPWLEYRERQGYKIYVAESPSSADGLKASIQEIAKQHPIKHLVLFGDAQEKGAAPNRLTPTAFVTAKVNVNYGSEPEIASDSWFADLDDDGLLDLNVGRIPADSEAELQRYFRRVYEYESRGFDGKWPRRINFVAGVGGFGQVLDKMIEQSVKKIVTDLIPSRFDVTMTYGSWRSPYCPDPRKFSETAIGRFNEGCLFWVYLGHGHRRQLDQIRLPDRRYSIMDQRNVARISSQSSFPIAILLSCYSAAIDGEQDGLGEMMMDQPNGPIALISSSRVSMPYGMGIFSLEVLDGYFNSDCKTLGELILQAKRKLVQFDPNQSEYHKLLHSMANSFSPDPEMLSEERKEHVHLMHLLGDPLLRLHRPESLKLSVPENLVAGQEIIVEGVAKEPGQLQLDLAYRRDRFRNRPPRRRSYQPSDEVFDEYQKVYERTQDLVCSRLEQKVDAGPFRIEFEIPSDCSGDCHVRGFLETESGIAMGSVDVFVKSEK